tara:strand:+ start:183 stop:476 length:294 start_codon:yes stop_codon:yes gene_type:complete|eukprot:scaffold6790_cov69-Phaeocystis_antarctica.AAC.11
MSYMFLTLEVSKLSGWLNADAALNIRYMLVTLEVSKLSGWLNADAPCRVERRGHTLRGEVRRGRRAGRQRRCKQRAQGRAGVQIGSGARGGERTLNM